MIIRERENWWRMLFVIKGSIIPRVYPQLCFLLIYAILVYYFNGVIYAYKVHLNPAVFTLMGVALAVFLGFLNSASYDRFWEGRKLWGALVIDTRSLTRQILSLVEDKDPQTTLQEKQYFVRLIAACAWSLNYQLRDNRNLGELERLLSPKDLAALRDKQFRPVYLLDCMARQLKTWQLRGQLDSINLQHIDSSLNDLSHIIGGCERIKNTPVPFAYHVLLHRTVYIYCFLLPFGLVDMTGWMMPILVLFIAYTFISLDAIVAEIGEPFGEEENDLALNSLCRTIEFAISEQADIPQGPLAKPQTYFVN